MVTFYEDTSAIKFNMKTLKDRLWAVYSGYYFYFSKALHETRNGNRTLQLDR